MKRVESIASLKNYLNPERLPFSLYEPGIPKGTVVSVRGSLGSGKTDFVLRFLSEHPNLRVSWVETPFCLYPHRLMRLGISLERFLFVSPDPNWEEIFWTVNHLLKSQVFGAVILSLPFSGLKPDKKIESLSFYRRMHLAARKSNSILFLVLSTFENSSYLQNWPVPLKLRVRQLCEREQAQSLDSWEIEIERQRFCHR